MLLVFALFYTTDQAKSLTLGSLLDFHKNLTMEKETWSAKIDMVKRKDFTKITLPSSCIWDWMETSTH